MTQQYLTKRIQDNLSYTLAMLAGHVTNNHLLQACIGLGQAREAAIYSGAAPSLWPYIKAGNLLGSGDIDAAREVLEQELQRVKLADSADHSQAILAAELGERPKERALERAGL